MNLEITVPELKGSSNSVSYTTAINDALDADIREIKAKSRAESKLFNELHRQLLMSLVQKFKTGEVFKKAS